MIGRVLVCHTGSVFVRQSLSWTSWSICYAWQHMRFCSEIVVLGEASGICCYLVSRRLLSVSGRCIGGGASSWWTFVASFEWSGCVCYFFRPLCRCGQRCWQRLRGLKCGKRAAGAYRLEHEVHAATRNVFTCRLYSLVYYNHRFSLRWRRFRFRLQWCIL